jgi:hypothetical protein
MATLNRGIKIVVEIVNVHVPIAETPSGRNMKVSNNLIDSDASLNAASFLSLRV